ncbi:MAG: cyclic nucleotide-binding domain-containing protein [Actinobacteria bacterium]|nr:cyclic nucleotide-binding domain-containing protein [Actinomycetota bacterium]MBV8563567.1 cyclic nucleotide-binding domain-containing protein [Actinomycetota bacterium]
MFGKNAKAEMLKRVPLFSDCSRAELARVAEIADEMAFPPGRTLIQEGKPGREFFVIADGSVDVRRKGRRLPQRGDASFFGEMALLTGKPRNASVTTTSPVRALVITDRAFKQLLDEVPSIRAKILTNLASRIPDGS